MKKITKVLLAFGLVLMVSASVSAGPTFFECFSFVGGHTVTISVPEVAVPALEAAGWICVDPCPFPPCV